MRPHSFASTMAWHSGRMRSSFRKTKMSSWKMTVRTPGCAATMRAIIDTHSAASSLAIFAVLPCAAFRKLVEEQNVHRIGQ